MPLQPKAGLPGGPATHNKQTTSTQSGKQEIIDQAQNII